MLKISFLISLLLLVTSCDLVNEKGNELPYIFGVFELHDAGMVIDPSDVAGYYSPYSNSILINPTNTIPAELGVYFGVEYVLPSELYGEVVLVKEVIHFPSPGLTNPKSGKYMSSLVDEGYKLTSEEHGMLYGLSESWEVQSGKWTFEVFANGELIIKQDFWISDS